MFSALEVSVVRFNIQKDTKRNSSGDEIYFSKRDHSPVSSPARVVTWNFDLVWHSYSYHRMIIIIISIFIVFSVSVVIMTCFCALYLYNMWIVCIRNGKRFLYTDMMAPPPPGPSIAIVLHLRRVPDLFYYQKSSLLCNMLFERCRITLFLNGIR